MAYTAWSVVFGEQPTAAKWNQLGTNDAGLRDGSNMAISQPINSDGSSHIDLRAGTNKLVKITVLRQDDTSNTYKTKSVILTGWGVAVVGAATQKFEAVTFGITFDQRPIVVGCYGGDSAVDSTTYGDGGNNVHGAVTFKATSILTTGFTMWVHTAGGASWGAGDTVFYQWIAIGELT